MLPSGGRDLQSSHQDTRAFTASFIIHLVVKIPLPLPTPHNKELYQTSIYSCRDCQINPSPFQKSAHCIFPLETCVSANLLRGCELTSLTHKLQKRDVAGMITPLTPHYLGRISAGGRGQGPSHWWLCLISVLPENSLEVQKKVMR